MGSPGSRGIRAAPVSVGRRGNMMNRAGQLLGLVLLFVGLAGLAQETGWMDPSADMGQFTDGPRAYHRDGRYAVASHGQEHIYEGYGISLPGGGEVVGIEVLFTARKDGPTNSSLAVELSWDGGVSWTATGYGVGPMPASWRDYVAGGSSDTWGRTWAPNELGDGAFQVRIRATHDSRLDWVAVRVHFREAIAQTLIVTPPLVDLGALTLAHYDAGYKEISPAQRVTVSSPTAWSLVVAADAATWTYTGSDAPPGKPSSHLEWRVNASGPGTTDSQTSYAGLTMAPHTVARGAAGSGLWLEVSLRIRVDYDTTVPGTYELRFTYTLTTP